MEWLSSNRMYVLPIYVIVLVVLVLIQQKVLSWQKNILRSFISDVDAILYQFTKVVYEGRDSIHDYENSVDLLYANRKEMLGSPNKNYIDHFPWIRDDVAYIKSLLGVEIAEESQLDSMDKTHSVLQQSRRLYRGIGWLVTLLTLWLYKLREPQQWRE